jgi:hypothetical protein
MRFPMRIPFFITLNMQSTPGLQIGIFGKIVDRIIGGQRTARRGLEESLKMIKVVMES